MNRNAVRRNQARLRLSILLPAALALAACALIIALLARKPAQGVQASVIGLTPTPSTSDYTRVTGPPDITFPRDFGPHPGFATEWWYYTGNLQSADGRHFGFQLTFFRRAVMPQPDWTPRPSDWATNQVYLAHFTLTDVSAKKFHYFEHYERGAAGLAGATVDPAFQVWLHNWSVQQTGDRKSGDTKSGDRKSGDTKSGGGQYRLRASENGVAIDLTLLDRKGPILQGDRGYSQKGPQPGNASIYFSQTHLESQGTVTVDGQTYPVTGLSWMDREISTSALSKGQVGWNWFALQLNDGSELMAYVLRRSDGSIDQFSSGTYIAPDGVTRPLKREDFQVTTLATWKSPHSGGVYPSQWRVQVPSQGIDLQVDPLLADQELNVSVVYWEGAVKISGTHQGKPVSGYGYVEQTGYARSLEGSL